MKSFSTLVAVALVVPFAVMLFSPAHAQSGANMSVDTTVDYLNNVLEKDLGRNFRKGPDNPWRILVDKRTKKIWIVSLWSDDPERSDYVTLYWGAPAADLDPEGLVSADDASIPQITVACRRSPSAGPGPDSGKCFQVRAFNDIVAETVFTLQAISTAKFLYKVATSSINTKGDKEASARFVRAFRHLIVVVKALPVDDPDDPFAGDSGSQGGGGMKQPANVTADQAEVALSIPRDTSLDEPLCPSGTMLLCSDLTSMRTNALACVGSQLADSFTKTFHFHSGDDTSCVIKSEGSRIIKADVCNSTAYLCGFASCYGHGGKVQIQGKTYQLTGVHGKYQYFKDLTSLDSDSELSSAIHSWVESEQRDKGRGFDHEYNVGCSDGENAEARDR